MPIYDYIPIEHTGMSEWTLFVFVILGIATVTTIKLFQIWKTNHDTHMCEQVKRIDEHERRLSDASTDMAVIKSDIRHVKDSLDVIRKPLEDMTELTQRVFDKVLNEDK